MKMHSCQQGSEDWFKLRAGKLTASNAQAIATAGKGLETLCYKTLADKYATTLEEGYTNSNMERGTELESQARSIYELETGVVVDQVGFIEYSDYVGGSPDGLIGTDGVVEIKCHDNTNHFRLLTGQDTDPKYVWQMQMLLLITGREYADMLAYCPNFSKSLIVRRFEKDADMHKKLLAGFVEGERLIKEIESKLK